jgi:hypothetical protein
MAFKHPIVLIARVITSLIFIARSKARAGYNGIHFNPPIWMRPYSDTALQTGHFICYGHRAHHLLPTFNEFSMSVANENVRFL